MVEANLSALLSAVAATLSAIFAAVSWYSWRAHIGLALPFIEVDYERLTNAHLIHWNKGGQTASEWSTEMVKIDGGTARLARYRSLMRPDKGRAWIGEVYDVGRALEKPKTELAVVDQPVAAILQLTFLLRSKAQPRLRRKLRHSIDVEPLETHSGGSAAKLFSGTIESI